MTWCRVLDIAEPASGQGTPTYQWNRYADQDGVISIPNYLENHSDRLRSRLLAFLYDLGMVRVSEKSIVEHLEVQEGFSLWWMSLIVEKSVYKSPRLFDCLRLFALEELLRHDKPAGIELISSDKILACAIQGLCTELDISFKWSCSYGLRKDSSHSLIRRLHSLLPRPVQALLWLARHWAERWPLRRARKRLASCRSGEITVFSYFIHLDTQSCAQGRFHSRHWGNVSELFNASGKGANWFHHYLQSPEVPKVRTGLLWLSRFNWDAAKQGHHLFIDCFLDGRILMLTLYNLLKFSAIAWRLRNVAHYLQASGLPVWQWPLIRRDFWESLCGSTAAQNLLWVELFNTAIRDLPRQRLGFYLYENQGWERAMMHAWRKYGHGELVAVAHSTVRYWDLRYFEDSRVFGAGSSCATLLPDKLAINGPAARDALLASGYPVKRLVEVEAQRYMGMSELIANRFANKRVNSNGRKRVLVLGDIMRAATDAMMHLLQKQAIDLEGQFDFTVKPHPGCPVSPADYLPLVYQVTHEPLNRILDQYDIAYAANATSASLDAYLAGLPVVIMLDEAKLNFSPLRAQAEVHFVSNAEELAEALLATMPKYDLGHESYFLLDAELPRWRSVINEQKG